MALHNQIETGFVVISWNVLHIIHEINYDFDTSSVIALYGIEEAPSNESIRLKDIVSILQQMITEHASSECFICLQEVPGDLLPILHTMANCLKQAFPLSKTLIHTHNYQRIPRLRQPRHHLSIYTNPTEYLVIIHYQPQPAHDHRYSLDDDQISWIQCPSDLGKGALILKTNNGLSIINIHVPFDHSSARALLANIPFFSDQDSLILVGDMNRQSKNLMAMINSFVLDQSHSEKLIPVTTRQATRVSIRSNGTRNESFIDYFVISTKLSTWNSETIKVFDDIGNISDHYPILLKFKMNNTTNKQ